MSSQEQTPADANDRIRFSQLLRSLKDCRIKVCSTWPDDRVNFWINADLCKKNGIAEWAEQLTFQNRLEINSTRQAIIESETQRVWGATLNEGDTVNWMDHDPDFTVVV